MKEQIRKLHEEYNNFKKETILKEEEQNNKIKKLEAENTKLNEKLTTANQENNRLTRIQLEKDEAIFRLDDKNTELKEKLIETEKGLKNLLQLMEDKNNELTRLKDENTKLIEENKIKEEKNQKLTQLTQLQKSEIYNLKKENYQYKETNNQLQLIQKINEEKKSKIILNKIDNQNKYNNEERLQPKQIKTTFDQKNNNMDKNEFEYRIKKEVDRQCNKAFPSTNIETTQKETNITNPQETQTFQKKHNTNIELKKSNDYKFGTIEDFALIGTLSFIEIGKIFGWNKNQL